MSKGETSGNWAYYTPEEPIDSEGPIEYLLVMAAEGTFAQEISLTRAEFIRLKNVLALHRANGGCQHA